LQATVTEHVSLEMTPEVVDWIEFWTGHRQPAQFDPERICQFSTVLRSMR
jgi:hypothetical protein